MQFKMVPIRPRSVKLIDESRFRIDASKALQDVRDFGYNQFQKTIKTWTTKPHFTKVGPTTVGDSRKVEVYTESEIYFYVEVGTRPHPIYPRLATRLRFRSSYKAKTTPFRIGSQRGGASGAFVSARSVQHPGTKGRFFAGIIAGQVRNKLEAGVLKAQRAAGISRDT